ncbi:alpha/beta fold hydrolase [Frigidibacter sp. ROC022]|uniref:alpha/beta fold hydrolase n=1 Tax=Frigidibacter sp. ROC022 TaxID=2971796 RepID=UPI00215B426C|nr:alpha/beta fold hydrolase [Frigidibacter sp. ROC022]MCR8724701.1 alpha/beta fold hydrolase [Frigidibacter sp. ROC022]
MSAGLIEAGRGRPILFLHGWTMRGALFADQIARLSDRFHCLAPDLPGHGDAPEGPADLDAAARAVHGLIAARGLRDVVLLGWSMGAAVAWRLARTHGTGGISGLVSVDMSPRIVNGPGWSLGLKGQTAASIAASTGRFRRDWQGSVGAIAAGMFAALPGPEGFGFDAACERIRACDPVAMLAAWESLVAMDERETIGRLPFPVLAAYGARSRVYPSEAASWIAATAPQGAAQGFTNSGHSPHLEEPGAFAAMVAGFAEGLD